MHGVPLTDATRSFDKLRTPRITSQIANGDEAYVALQRERMKRGPWGEASLAEIWHTADRGRSWHMLPWRRAARSFLPPALFARWPPEWINRMWLSDTRLEIEVWEDGGWESKDPIWRATWNGARWRVGFVRYYDVEADGSILPPELELDLPGITTPPAFGPFR